MNTAMVRRSSKPGHDYMGFNSIKSSFKSDPNSGNKIRISNSISSDCLNAQKLRRPMKIRGTQGESNFKLTLGSGEQNLKTSQ